MINRIVFMSVVGVLLIVPFSVPLFAQDDLAAVLEVRTAGVEVKRVNTEQWLPIGVETIVGVGDDIRTDGQGQARIIFFADGTETDLMPNTEYRIEAFAGNEEAFSLQVAVLAGQTVQRVNRVVDSSSTYDVNTPGMSLVARGTEFRIRVEDDGRSAMLVDDGAVGANVDMEEVDDASVTPGFGIRSEVGNDLSDVVPANTFATLDSAIDGCGVTINTEDDVQLNVRLAPSVDFPRIGTVDPNTIPIFVGATETTGWFRIEFRGGFGWVLASDVDIEEGCAGLRPFADASGAEDPSLYEFLGEEIDIDSLLDSFTDTSAESQD